MPEVSAEIVKKFFLSLRRLKEEGNGESEVKELIKQHPDLWECKCPSYADTDSFEDKSWLDEGYDLTAVEIMCTEENQNPGGRDAFCDLVKLGAKATENCYALVLGGYSNPGDFMAALLSSGYMPVSYMDRYRGSCYCLDRMVDKCDGDNDERMEWLEESLKLLHPKLVKIGDNFGFGPIEAHVVENLQNLPKLKAGVTHEENGPFDELLTHFRKAYKVEDEEEEEEDKENGKEEVEKSEGEVPKKKKQRC